VQYKRQFLHRNGMGKTEGMHAGIANKKLLLENIFS